MNIAIIGAGVAGLASAIALTQKGFCVQVYERRPAPSSLGAGIVLWPNAVFVLDQLGLRERIAIKSGRPIAMQRYTCDGEKLGRIEIQTINRNLGYDSYSILRRDFHAILHVKVAELGIRVNYSHEVAEYIENARNKVDVLFGNGIVASPDIIIAADGRMNSHARRFVSGSNTPKYQRCVNWIGVFESKRITFDTAEIQDYWGVGERFGIVPVTHYKAYWAGGAAESEMGARIPDNYQHELLTRFSKWPEPIATIIRKSNVDSFNKIYLHDLDPLQTWHRGNLITIGDAAHAALPTSGQGACQALEDAWHLANCLIQSPSDIENVFTRLAEIRFKKTLGVIHAARHLASEIFNTDADYCKTRNEKSRASEASSVATSIAEFWGQGLPLRSPKRLLENDI